VSYRTDFIDLVTREALLHTAERVVQRLGISRAAFEQSRAKLVPFIAIADRVQTATSTRVSGRHLETLLDTGAMGGRAVALRRGSDGEEKHGPLGAGGRDADSRLVYRLTLPCDPIEDTTDLAALVAGQCVAAIVCERPGMAQIFYAKTLDELRGWAARVRGGDGQP
jgi:hypothetical protein